MFRYKTKGFTLVELLITLAILGTILSAIYTFFLTNYKTINRAQIEVELQSEGERVIEKISNIAIQCSEMKLTTSDNDDKIDSPDDSIEFIVKETVTLIVKATHRFELGNNNKLLLDGVEFGQFMEHIKCTKVTNGVELEIKLRKNDIEKFIITTIYFRNAM